MNEQTATEWRDCADPDELAAAVAAGVEVQRMMGGWWVPSALTHRDDFAWFLTHGTRYQLPASWTWRPEPPAPDEVVAPDDDLRERIARVGQDTDPELVRQPEPPADDLRERTLAQVATGSAAWSAVRRHLTQFEPITSAADMDALASEIADAVLAVLATPPVPPWPGAVLSGLVDEDGVPTWLALAGQVRGEQVRGWRDMAWYRPHGHSSDTWVEVRAPRAVPEPERVSAVSALPPVPPWPGDENDDTARLSPDQGDRIVNACCRMLGCEPADIDGDAALEEILTEAVERCADLHGQDRWEDDCHGCGFRVGDHTTDGRCPAPAAPVPPWPGAVLSGLVDEDGVPTWLAQAGNVQGESVRTCADFPWFVCGSDNASDRTWVEVRAPRAVPEPKTERVDALKVLRDRSYRVVWMKDHAAPACSIGPWNDDVAVWSAAECRGYVQPIAPDGTVEVLKDGGQ